MTDLLLQPTGNPSQHGFEASRDAAMQAFTAAGSGRLEGGN